MSMSWRGGRRGRLDAFAAGGSAIRRNARRRCVASEKMKRESDADSWVSMSNASIVTHADAQYDIAAPPRHGRRRRPPFQRLVDIMRSCADRRLPLGSRADASSRCGRSCSRKPTSCSTPSTAATSTRCAGSSATSCSKPSFSRGSRTTGASRSAIARRDRRQAHSPPPARVRPTAAGVETPGEVVEKWEDIKARNRRTPARSGDHPERRPEDVAGPPPRLRDRHARRRRRLRLGQE